LLSSWRFCLEPHLGLEPRTPALRKLIRPLPPLSTIVRKRVRTLKTKGFLFPPLSIDFHRCPPHWLPNWLPRSFRAAGRWMRRVRTRTLRGAGPRCLRWPLLSAKPRSSGFAGLGRFRTRSHVDPSVHTGRSAGHDPAATAKAGRGLCGKLGVKRHARFDVE
jgi:hypothetical protein